MLLSLRWIGQNLKLAEEVKTLYWRSSICHKWLCLYAENRSRNYGDVMDERMRHRIEALQAGMVSLGKESINLPLPQQLIENIKVGLLDASDPDEMNAFRINLTQSMLVFYREVKKRDPDAAFWLLRSYQEDHPEIPGSKLFNKFMSLLEASYNAQRTAQAALKGHGDRSLIFMTSKECYRSGSEFLSALMGWMYPLFQAWEGKPPEWKALKWPDAKKQSEFERISKGRDGIFFMLTPLVNKHLRNAIAHGDIQLDAQNGKVLYSNQIEGQIVESEMDLTEFVGISTYLFSRLPAIYLGVLSTIAVFEFGSIEDKLRLPAFSVEKISGVTLSNT